jgi:hypothetical protein
MVSQTEDPPGGSKAGESLARSLKPEEVASVRAHLATLLESDAFRGSERSKQFLSFVIERTLEGRQSEIKERTIGTDLFGRPADYDMVGDSIVRVKANEVRRRLGRFYSELGDAPVRIELAPGSYVPLIHWPNPEDAASRAAAPLAVVEALSGGRPRQLLVAAAAVAALGLVLAAVFLVRWKTPSAMDRFWEPVVASSEAPILRLPDYQSYLFTRQGQEVLDNARPDATSLPIGPGEYRKVLGFHVSAPTFHAAVDLALFLERKGRTPQLRIGADLTSAELRRHPVIAVSSRPSEWAMEEASGMRFRFRPVEGRTTSPYMIEDRSHPEAGWRVDNVYPFESQTSDYALISRTFDSSTRNVSVSVSGLTSFGSQAAAAFLTNPDGWKQVVAEAPSDWTRRNLQIVLRSALVGRTPGTARIVAVHCW